MATPTLAPITFDIIPLPLDSLQNKTLIRNNSEGALGNCIGAKNIKNPYVRNTVSTLYSTNECGWREMASKAKVMSCGRDAAIPIGNA